MAFVGSGPRGLLGRGAVHPWVLNRQCLSRHLVLFWVSLLPYDGSRGGDSDTL